MATTKQEQIATAWVRMRTSWTYLYTFLGLSLTWIVLNKTGLVHLDNDDLTYLNLSLSILAEVSAIVLLIYLSRMEVASKAQEVRDREFDKELHKKIDLLLAKSSHYGTFG